MVGRKEGCGGNSKGHVQSLMVHASRRAALCKSGIQGGMQKLNTEVESREG